MSLSIESPDLRSSNNAFIFLTYLMESSKLYNGQKCYHEQATVQNETSCILNLIGITYSMENVYEDWIFAHPNKHYALGVAQGTLRYFL